MSSHPADGRLKVLVVDDAVLPRGMISRWLEEDIGAEVRSAANGRVALNKLEDFDADVVTLDLEMPVLSGYETIPLIRDIRPETPIIVVSGASRGAGELTFDALHKGAADFVAKQGRDRRSAFRQELVNKVQALGQARAIQTAGHLTPVRGRPRVAAVSDCRRRVVAIGASTGGPEAVASLLRGLKGSLDVPVLISQHLPRKFSSVFAATLARKTGLDCQEARNGDIIRDGRVYVAPGDRHLLVRQSGKGVRIVISDAPPELHCRPAVNPMFRSVAAVYGRRALAIVLTGMGTDGADGGQSIVRAGGMLAVQDKQSSIVWGMPGAVIATGATDRIHSLKELSTLIGRVCR